MGRLFLARDFEMARTALRAGKSRGVPDPTLTPPNTPRLTRTGLKRTELDRDGPKSLTLQSLVVSISLLWLIAFPFSSNDFKRSTKRKPLAFSLVFSIKRRVGGSGMERSGSNWTFCKLSGQDLCMQKLEPLTVGKLSRQFLIIELNHK